MAWMSSYVRRTLLLVALCALVGSIALLLGGQSAAWLGWIWGCLGSAAYVLQLGTHTQRLAHMSPEQGRAYLRRTALARLSLAGCFVLTAAYMPGVDPVATGVGLLVYRIAFYLDACRRRGRDTTTTS